MIIGFYLLILAFATCISAKGTIIYDNISKQNISSILYQVGPNGVKELSYDEYRKLVLEGIKHKSDIASKIKGIKEYKTDNKVNITQDALTACAVVSYDQSESTTWLDGTKHRASSSVNCAGGTSCSITKTTSTTVSESFTVGAGISLSGSDKNVVSGDANLSYTWQKSWSNSEAYSISFNHGTAYIAFQFEMQDTLGTAHRSCRGEKGVPSTDSIHVYAASSAGYGTYSLVYV